MKNLTSKFVDTSEGKIYLATGGKGFPLLLLHGYPQTHWMWRQIAPQLAQDFTVVATDLRGYGYSHKPLGMPDHSNYSKRVMAAEQVEVMAKLGYDEFYVIGHDRGGRVAHRLALDYPSKVKKLALLDILPTYYMYQQCDRYLATAYYHWFFLIQPFPFPENLIINNSAYFLRSCLQKWSYKSEVFTEDIVEEYLGSFKDYATIHGTCEDYRAAATIDLEHDQQDLSTQITAPLLLLWGGKGIIGKRYDVLNVWQDRAVDVRGYALDCGHFLPEEDSANTYQILRNFFV